MALSKQYIVTGFVPGRSTFVEILNVPESTLNFDAKTAQVKVGNTSQRMTSAGLSLVIPKTITETCGDVVTCVGEVNQSVKIHFNVAYGDDTAVGTLVSEAIRLLGLWREQHAAYGVVPSQDGTMDQED